jgi:hypothetical protein
MIKFSLRCSNKHEFESWFQNGAVFEAQTSSGLVLCPICQTSSVAKAIMAPAVARRGRGGPAPACEAPAASPADPPAPVALLSTADEEVRALIAELRKRILEQSDDLGANFAEEALKIHHGLVPDRLIHGQATFEEAHALVEEGVQIMPIPRAPGDLN